MFIPRSARRIRLCRTLFVCTALLPCAGLVAWAVHRHSTAHRDAVLRAWEQAVGLPLGASAIEHPLPDAIRARECTLAAADGTVVLAAGAVTVETTPTEVRLAIDALACDAAGAAVLAGLADEWLWRGARFRRDVVIDVAEFAWQVPGPEGHTERHELGPVRIECVAQAGARAVRAVRRRAADGADELRVVRSIDGTNAAGAGRMEIAATCTAPLPWPILAAVTDAAPPFGTAATARGSLTATGADGGWQGTATGRVAGVDLATFTAALPAGAAGTMTIDVDHVEWRDGRLAACGFTCDAAAGRLERRLLDALVGTLGCRGGAGSPAPTADRDRAFDAAGCEVRIDGRGIAVRGLARLGGAVVVADGRPLLEPPLGLVPPERLAWLLAPSGAVYVPSSGPGARLLALLPEEGGSAERTSSAGPAEDGGDF